MEFLLSFRAKRGISLRFGAEKRRRNSSLRSEGQKWRGTISVAARSFDLSFIIPVSKIKKPREKHEANQASPFLAKGAGCGGLGGCPDLRRFADHSGGTVADSHGLPRFPNLLIIVRKSMLREERCQPYTSGNRRTWELHRL